MKKRYRKKIKWISLIFVLSFLMLLPVACSRQTPEEKVREDIVTARPDSVKEEGKQTEAEDGESYHSPIDFEALKEQNEDICAWLDIPETDISYPILKNEQNEEFYLDHDSLKGESRSGALFIDSYNQADFQDPLSVIYGHHMKSGAFFGKLQSEYENLEEIRKHQEMILYLPEEERHYFTFAAVPYDAIHILYNYDFSDAKDFFIFFDRIYETRSLVGGVIEEEYPEFGEKVIILSTCLQGDNSRRYLVLARERE